MALDDAPGVSCIAEDVSRAFVSVGVSIFCSGSAVLRVSLLGTGPDAAICSRNNVFLQCSLRNVFDLCAILCPMVLDLGFYSPFLVLACFDSPFRLCMWAELLRRRYFGRLRVSECAFVAFVEVDCASVDRGRSRRRVSMLARCFVPAIRLCSVAIGPPALPICGTC